MIDAPSVLMITGEYPPVPGGVGDYTARLSSELAKVGARVTVLTRGRETRPERQPSPGQPQVARAIRNWGYASWPSVAQAARAQGVHIVHLQYQAAAYAMHPSANLLPCYLRVRLPRVRIVTTFHDLRVPYLFPKAGRLRQEAIRTLDALSHASVVTNQADLEQLENPRQWAARRLKKRWLIPIGSNIDNLPPADFDRPSWRRHLGADEDTLVISYFGFMNDSKGVEYLVEALALLSERGIKLRLLVAGGETGESDPTNIAYSQKIASMIRDRQLEDMVFWTGFVPPEQVSAALLSSDLCVLPFRDGASLRRGSLLAALVHELPTVTTLPTRPEPLLVNGGNVAMVMRDDPGAIADVCEHLWRDPQARARLAAGARTLAGRFEWPEIAARHMEMYRLLLAGPRARRR